MTQVLAIIFFAMLSFNTAPSGGVLSCLKCRDVERNNNCKSVERVCKGGAWVFCYTRLVVREHGRTKVDRGCTKVCRSLKRKRKYKYEETMECCEKDLCNIHNFWTATQ